MSTAWDRLLSAAANLRSSSPPPPQSSSEPLLSPGPRCLRLLLVLVRLCCRAALAAHPRAGRLPTPGLLSSRSLPLECYALGPGIQLRSLSPLRRAPDRRCSRRLRRRQTGSPRPCTWRRGIATYLSTLVPSCAHAQPARGTSAPMSSVAHPAF